MVELGKRKDLNEEMGSHSATTPESRLRRARRTEYLGSVRSGETFELQKERQRRRAGRRGGRTSARDVRRDGHALDLEERGLLLDDLLDVIPHLIDELALERDVVEGRSHARRVPGDRAGASTLLGQRTIQRG